MISYAQNAEDVVLARALGDVDDGFYVDVGAASPFEATVTRHFYEAGWNGINIEPLPEWAAELRLARPRDTNLEVAVGAIPEHRVLYRVVEDPALSTLQEEIAANYRRGSLHVEEIRVEITTLSQILDEVSPERIDFLKIDVEGAEAAVLAGLDLRRWRPRVILAESTRPTTLVPTYQGFEARLIAERYVFAATDGVNRYYAREEEADLLVPRLVPANSTDDYVALREQLLEEEVGRLRVYIRHLERDLDVAKEAASRAAPTPSAEPAGVSPRVRPERVIALDRLAVCTTPQTGGTRLGAYLETALGARGVHAEHPGDLNWNELPERAVLELCWPRTEQLAARLMSNGFRVVSVVRHPVESLLAYLRLAQSDRSTRRFLDGAGGPDDALWRRSPETDAFGMWATSGRAERLLDVSASWVTDPAALRVHFDALGSDPQGVVADLLELGGFEPPEEELVPKRGQPLDLEAIEGGWRRYVSAGTLERLLPIVVPVLQRLGLADDLAGSSLPESREAESNWWELVGRAT